MATAKTSPLTYLPGDSPEIQEANRQYQDALKKLTESLDQRKNRLFDPTWLAITRGFLEPGAIDVFESFGRVAKNVGEAQFAQEKEERDIAQLRLDAATRGLDLQRQKVRQQMIADYYGGGQGGLPSGGPAAQPAPEGDQFGFQIAPPEKRLTGRQYFSLAILEGVPYAEAMQKAAQIDRENQVVKEGGVFDPTSGRFFPSKFEQVEFEVFPGQTFTIPQGAALELSRLAREGNLSKYNELANRIIRRQGATPTTTPATTPAATPAASVAPAAQAVTPTRVGADTAAPSADAGRIRSREEIKARERQTELEQSEAKTRAEALAKAAAEKEAGVQESEDNARRIFGGANRVLDYLKASPNYFGIFSRPGIISAIGKLIKEGVQTPGGTLNLAGFEDAVRSVMPRVKQSDLDNIQLAAAELAEIELAFTRLYLAKQGAVTEGERKIVRAIPGSVSNSPEVLRTRLSLLSARAQYDIDVADAFRQWQQKNPGQSYLKFERDSKEYKEIKKNFEAETERIFGGIRAVPTRERAQQAQPTGAPPSERTIRDPETGRIRARKPGE